MDFNLLRIFVIFDSYQELQIRCVMLDEYIKELIANNNRVIIPNFGAFLLRATSENKNKKKLSAKVNDVYFSPFLKFNDELLMNHVISKENVTQKEAMDRIGKYISTIENSVKENGVYSIEGLGEFYMDDKGKIQFKIQPSTHKGGAQEAKQPPPRKESEPKETPKASTVNEQAARKKAHVTQAKSDEQEKAKTEKQETPPSRDKTEKTVKTGKAAGKTPPPPSSEKEKTKTDSSGAKSNKGLILSIVIGVPVAALFIWAMLNFDTVQNLFTQDEPRTPVTKTMDETASEKSSGQKATQEPTQTRDQQDTQVEQQAGTAQQQGDKASGGKKYYLVAGSFKKRENAVNFREELLDKGYDSELIGERNGMHAVSYASFQNKSRAKEELQRLRNEEGLQVWLLYY